MLVIAVKEGAVSYLGTEWGHSGKGTRLERIASEFEIAPSELDGIKLIIGAYHYESYEGDAFVLFIGDGELWEVNASHCSCFELQDQWKPEKADPKELRHRLDKGTHYGGVFADPIVAGALDAWLTSAGYPRVEAEP